MTALAREQKPDSDDRQQLVIVNPATLTELERVDLMTAEEVREQVRRAQQAFSSWSGVPVAERAKYILRARDYLLEHVDQFTATITAEMGKPQVESLMSEVLIAADLMSYYAERAPEILADREIPIHLFKLIRQSTVRSEPLGVVSIISPWNYPFSIHVSSIVFALLAGNTVVAKAASDATLVGRRIEEMFTHGAGLPEGVLNFVVASGSSLGTSLYEPPVRKVVFTGSTETGTMIMQEAAKHLIPVTLELGGKDAMVVLPDADIDRAAAGAVWGAFFNCGQTCASVERCYVHRSIYDEFVDRVTTQVRKLRQGDGSDPAIDIGPLANKAQLELVEEHVEDALAHGARLLTGGKHPAELEGYFYEPTVLTNVDHSMRCMTEETFGPTLPIVPFDTEDEAIELANDSRYGLTASIWSRDRERATHLASRLEAGTVSINDHASSYGLPETPWRGVKHSGIGVSHGDEGLKEFTQPKHIAVDRVPLASSPWWFPYSAAKYKAFKVGIQMVLGDNNVGDVVGTMRETMASLSSGGELNNRAWKSVRSAITGDNGECKEEDPPESFLESLFWLSTPCKNDAQDETRS